MTDENDIRNYGFRLLAKREYSVCSLTEKLAKRFPESQDDISNIVADFVEKKFLSDERFTEIFVEDKINLKMWGPRKIALELSRKGIDDALSKKIIFEKFLPDIQIQKITTLANEKHGQILKNPRIFSQAEIRQKLTQFLSGKGFDFEYIIPVIESLDISD